MLKRGLSLDRKPKAEPDAPREPDLSTTSRAKRALEWSKKNNEPVAHEALSAKIAEKYPDILQERR